MITRQMLLERREKLVSAHENALATAHQLLGALQCIDELLEADEVPTAQEALEQLGITPAEEVEP